MPEDQTARQDPRAEFINVSVWHGSLDRAQEILADHPEVASSDIHTAAVLGDHEVVGRFLAADMANATAKGGPRNWDALTHFCFSKFLRLEPARTEGFLPAHRAQCRTRIRIRTPIDRRAKADHRTCGQSWSESSPALTWNETRAGNKRRWPEVSG